MNRLIKIGHLKSSILYGLSNLTKNEQNVNNLIKRTFMNGQPLMAGFTKDFKPGPYPKTEAERLAAAKKYGLKPEDYEPYPDDGMGFGDYPKLKPITPDMRSDFDEWDDPYNKRNFGEPVVITQEQLTGDKVSLKPQAYSFSYMIFLFSAAGFVFFGLGYALKDYKVVIPIAPKQYPRNAIGEDAEKHYKI